MYQFVLGGRAVRSVNILRKSAMHRGAFIWFPANRNMVLRASLAMAAMISLSTRTAAQTWTGAASGFGNWGNAAHWINPSQVPNSETADVVFAPTAGDNFVVIPAVFSGPVAHVRQRDEQLQPQHPPDRRRQEAREPREDHGCQYCDDDADDQPAGRPHRQPALHRRRPGRPG